MKRHNYYYVSGFEKAFSNLADAKSAAQRKSKAHPTIQVAVSTNYAFKSGRKSRVHLFERSSAQEVRIDVSVIS